MSESGRVRRNNDDDDDDQAAPPPPRPFPAPFRAYEPRLEQELRDTPFYKLAWLTRIDLLSRHFVNALDYNKRDGGFRAANRALDGFCSVSRENREICRKSGEFLHGLLGPISGPGKLRDTLFLDIAIREFDFDFPDFVNRTLVDLVLGTPTGQQMGFTRPELPWETFFRAAFFALTQLLKDKRDEFNRGYGAMHLFFERLGTHYTTTWPLGDELMMDASFSLLYASLLHHFRKPLRVRFAPSTGTEVMTGTELARRVLREMLLKGEVVSMLVRLDGTLFDGREVYTAVVEEGGQFEALVKGQETYTQVRAAFFQSPDKRIWVPFLSLPIGSWNEDPERAASRIQVTTLMFLVHHLSEANLLSQQETMNSIERYMAFIMWRERAKDEDDAWASNLFFSRRGLNLESVKLDVRRARSLEDVKTLYRNNNSGELWREVFYDVHFKHGFPGWMWVARQLWENMQLPADQLRTLITRELEQRLLSPYSPSDNLSDEEEWLQEMRRTRLPN